MRVLACQLENFLLDKWTSTNMQPFATLFVIPGERSELGGSKFN